jgi:hypothetical protein
MSEEESMIEKEVVDKFLSDVFDTVISDLRQMMSHPQGLDFGMIILICSGIELIGALDYGSLRNSKRRFQEALGNYFPSRYSDYKKTLYKRFRCGLAHQAFIKPGTATARDPEFRQYHLWGVLAEGEGDKLLFIHPDVFAEDFFAAIEKFRNSLDADPEKVGRAYRAIKEIYRDYRDSGEPIELHLSLPSDGLEITRQPLPKWVGKSEVSMGSIAFEDEDINS